MSVVNIIVLLLLALLGYYLREKAINSTYGGGTTITEDIKELLQSLKRWRENKKLKKKYK